MDRVRIYVPLHAWRLLTKRAQFTHACSMKRAEIESFRRAPPLLSTRSFTAFDAPKLHVLPPPSFVLRPCTRAWHAPRKGSTDNGAAEINRAAPTKFTLEKPRGTPTMMATDILKQQHREFEELMRQIETAEDDEERIALRVELADMLAAHTAIEEELFYPAALDQLGPGSRIRESLEEHAIADFALYRLMAVSVVDETFVAKLATLKDVVMNHIEEEESELLPQAEGEMDRQALEQLGDKMTARFEERLHEGHRSILERSLGIAARQAPVVAPVAKKAAPARRTTAKVKATSKKRAMVAAKRGSAPKRAATTKKVAASKKAASRAQSAPRNEPSSPRSTSRQNQGSTRAAPKSGRRAAATRGQTASKKSRATG